MRKILSFALIFILTLMPLTLFGCSRVSCICDNRCNGACNFELTIEIDNHVLTAAYVEWMDMYLAGEPPSVTARLTNISNRNINIAYRDFGGNAVTFNVNTLTGVWMIDRGGDTASTLWMAMGKYSARYR